MVRARGGYCRNCKTWVHTFGPSSRSKFFPMHVRKTIRDKFQLCPTCLNSIVLSRWSSFKEEAERLGVIYGRDYGIQKDYEGFKHRAQTAKA